MLRLLVRLSTERSEAFSAANLSDNSEFPGIPKISGNSDFQTFAEIAEMRVRRRAFQKAYKFDIRILKSKALLCKKWCEALSAVSHLHEVCAAQMAGESFDVNHWFYILFSV